MKSASRTSECNLLTYHHANGEGISYDAGRDFGSCLGASKYDFQHDPSVKNYEDQAEAYRPSAYLLANQGHPIF